MVDGVIDIKTKQIICPTCDKSNFVIFRKDKIEEEIYLNHCKCKNCGQLFVYKADLANRIVID